MGNSVADLFPGINIPSNVEIVRVENLTDLLHHAGRHSMLGFSGHTFFGNLFVQGQRLQFGTAAPLDVLIDIANIHRADKKSTVYEVEDHFNRPKEKSHAQAIQRYLLTTACINEKFILPGFIFNSGVKTKDEQLMAKLLVYAPAGAADGTSTYPAVMLLPKGARLDMTDGAHRGGNIVEIAGRYRGEELADNLLSNAVTLTIVFEASASDSHQDFADCAKAKPIAKSLVATYDVRDFRNRLTRDLVVKRTAFLGRYVDATASGVNLSAQSAKVWSMSSVRGFVGHVVDNYRVEADSLPEEDKAADRAGFQSEQEAKLAGAPDFFAAVVEAISVLKALDDPNANPASKINDTAVRTGDFRMHRGGNVLLRGVGMYILARAYVHCMETGMAFAEMAKVLANVDWYILPEQLPEDKKLPDGTQAEGEAGYAEVLFQVCNPIWRFVLVVKGNRHRITSSGTEVDMAWAAIQLKHGLTAKAAAAAE